MSKRGHVPVRMCIGCRSRRRKEEMIRFVRTAEGLVPVARRTWNGRGFYLCPDSECLRKAQKKNPTGQVINVEVAQMSVMDRAGGGNMR